MRVVYVDIKNFRGISNGKILLPKHGVLIGDNNTGKTTLLEAIDLTLGPDRLNRQPPIDEHDFFQGKYRPQIKESQEISIGDQNPDTEESADTPDIDLTEEFSRIEIEVVTLPLHHGHWKLEFPVANGSRTGVGVEPSDSSSARARSAANSWGVL